MKEILLQVPVEQVGIGVTSLFQYGAVGVMLVFITAALVYMYKTNNTDTRAEKNAMGERVAKLEERQNECEKKHESFIMNEYSKSNLMIEKCTALLEEVKSILIKKG
jgi:Flp pilus assembly protein TadD